MVSSSPLKRSALGSISSILNTTPKTPAKQGRVGKSATPRTSGVRRKLANMFSGNKEDSPRKIFLGSWSGRERQKVQRNGQNGIDLLPMLEDSVPPAKVDGVRESCLASDVDVSMTSNVINQPTTLPPPKISPEIRKIALLLSSRLRLAAYKVSTQQIQTPFSELSALPTVSCDSVSQAIQRFQESKRLQERTEYYRKYSLAKVCRRESRRARRVKSTDAHRTTLTIPLSASAKSCLGCQPSTITEGPSDQEEPGLLSPPDSQPSKTSPNNVPNTPAPKPKVHRVKRTKTYDEHDGQLGLSSPPQQAYDPHEKDEDWCTNEIEVGDVPSSVLRGVECLWALGC